MQKFSSKFNRFFSRFGAIFLATSLPFFGLNAAKQESDAILAIEISSAKVKSATFTISSNDSDLEQKIKNNLKFTGRFKFATFTPDVNELRKNGVDILVRVKSANGFVKIEIFDIMQNRQIQEFSLDLVNRGETIKEICNQIYSSWLNEPGLFKTAIIFSYVLNKNLSLLSQIPYADNQTRILSGPISYINDLVFINSQIFITKFSPKHRSFGIYAYEKNRKIFTRIINIKNSSVFCPFSYKNQLYVSASNSGTTGIYSLPLNYPTREFANFNTFSSDKNVKKISKIHAKIATSMNVNEFGSFFCNNYNGRPKIAKLPNIVVSGKGAYFNPVLNGTKIAAIKLENGMFHLILINLQTKKETTLLSHYFIDKPCWSPCGNWIAVSCREKGGKNHIILVHRSGKYAQTLPIDGNATNPIWVQL